MRKFIASIYLLALMVIFPSVSYAQTGPMFNLSDRIEIEHSGKILFRRCKFLSCETLGRKMGYSADDLRKVFAKNLALGVAVKAILEEAIKQDGSKTYALLSQPYKHDQLNAKSALGYGGSGFLGVYSAAEGKGAFSQSDFIYTLVPEAIGQFQYFAEGASIADVASGLSKALK